MTQDMCNLHPCSYNPVEFIFLILKQGYLNSIFTLKKYNSILTDVKKYWFIFSLV